MKMKLSTKLITTYLGVGLIPLALIGAISWMVASGGLGTVSGQGATALETAAYDQLKDLCEIKDKQVTQYFAERKGDLGVLVENAKAINANAWGNLVGIQETKRSMVTRLLTDTRTQLTTLSHSHALRTAFADFKAYHDQSGARHDGDLDVASDEYKAVYDKWYDEFAVQVKQHGYYDFFLICAAHGHVLFSEGKESDLGANVGSGSLRNEGLGILWRKVVDSRKFCFADFEPYSPSDGDYAAFAGAPVLDANGKVIAVLAFQLPTDPINAIVQARTGLGESGETYLVGDLDGRTSFRSDLLTMGDGKYIVGAEIHTDYIDKAIAGESGQHVFFDSAGRPVMVCYDSLGIEGVNWAQVTKMDMEECFTLKAKGESEDFFTKYNNAYGYYDLFLFHPSGYCFYSVCHEADYHTNLVTGEYANSALGKATKECLSTQQFAFGDFAPYEPSAGTPAAFIAQPVVVDGEAGLVVALQLSDAAVSDMMAAGSNKERALEAYLVGPDGHMRSNSILAPDTHTIAASFKQGNKVDTDAVRGAMSGGTDAKVITDYLGSQVLSAWTPLDIYGTKWALICEIDEAVAMAARTDMVETSTSANTQLVMWIVGGLIVVGIVVAFLAWSIARSVSKPLTAAVESLTMGSDQVTSAAGQVAQSSQSLAEGTSEQASSLEETSASLEEITSMTRQNTDNSNQAKGLAAQAQSDAGTGSEAMTRMSEAISGIKASADETAGIVKTIEEIAFQTNLLALNAAVEAARAGDAGKGFAVVAEEVRNLAQRAAEAARSTGDLITGSVKSAENGVAISKEVAEALGKIAEGSTKVNEITGEVAAASQEQTQGIDQINTAVSQMDQVTQQNAANSEEGASAAEELSAQAAEMMKVVEGLADLVGGARNGSGTVKATGAQPMLRASLPAPRQRRGATSVSNGPGTRKVVSPEEVVPLDDDDLSDF